MEHAKKGITGRAGELVFSIEKFFRQNPGYSALVAHHLLDFVDFFLTANPEEEYFFFEKDSVLSVKPNKVLSQSPRISVTLVKKLTH